MSGYTDQEQVEMLKRWWNEHGKVIAIAIIVGLGLGFGWRYWQSYQVKQANQASQAYQVMTTARSINNKLYTQMAQVLIQKYSSTAYASFAAFYLAADAIKKNDLTNAMSQLQWVIKHAKEQRIVDLARIRAARVLLAQKQPQQALAMLDQIKDKTFQPLEGEVRGDIYAAQGKTQQAQKAYQDAKTNIQSMGLGDPVLALKASQ